MLGKLLKYEFKATGRTFLPMYALLIAFALLNKIFITINADYLRIPQVIAMVGFVVIIAGISVMTLIVTIQRFNKNLLTDEGYLSFTLPVKTHTHIDCKMIVSAVWCLASFIMSAISIFILALDQSTLYKTRRFFEDIGSTLNQLGPGAYLIILECILFVAVALLASITNIYAAITVGNLSSKHKLLAGLGAYFGFGMVQQIVVSILMTVFFSGFDNYMEYLTTAGAWEQMRAVQLGLLVMLLYTAVFGAIFYFLTEWLLRKKLNLE
ncbi:MAG: hypothetical protein GX424_03160 [Clostridiales bacterium]|jgi:hypothetical protein|nr:hypothetical protein [Clostridiales bacterium]